MIKVSVIVPVYNTEKYLRRCLDSLVNQTLDEIEIIVINDCSTDNSKEIIKEYKNKYKNIVLIDNKVNKGIGYNRNTGIKKAKGKYIAFVDSDDWVNETMYDKMYKKATDDNLDLVLCNYIKVLEDGDELTEIECDYFLDYFNSTNLEESPNLLLDVNLAPWNKLYKRELLNGNSFPQDLKYEDAIFVIKALSRAKKIGIVEEKLNYYLVRSKSETTVMDKRVFDILKIIDEIVLEMKSKKYYDDIKVYVEALVIKMLFRYTLQQKYQKDECVKNKFIDEAFLYLNNNFPGWKENEIWRKRNFLKRMIEKNKVLTKVYCKFF